MFTVGGIANAVYHPADYAILSQRVAAPRIGRVYSLHNFAGIAGSAAAPPVILVLEGAFGWRGAFVGAGLLGLVIGLALAAYREQAPGTAAPENPVAAPGQAAAPPRRAGLGLLLSLPILQNFFFFVLLTVINAGMTTYLVAGLGALHGTSVITANLALSVSLAVNGAAVLIGGWLAGKTARHGLVAVCGLTGTATMMALVTLYDMPPVLLIAVMSGAGFCVGIMMPSRDMLVRSVTPPGQFGTVFGFVTTGFNVGGVFSPLLFGALLDYGRPAGVFLMVVACCLIGMLTVVTMPRRQAASV
jgi:MFS family permease